MFVDRLEEGDSVILHVVGRIDTATVTILEEAVNGCLEEAKLLVFDCAELEYVSSVGLRVFLRTQKAIAGQGAMKLVNVNETVMEVLDITGFSDILTIE